MPPTTEGERCLPRIPAKVLSPNVGRLVHLRPKIRGQGNVMNGPAQTNHHGKRHGLPCGKGAWARAGLAACVRGVSGACMSARLRGFAQGGPAAMPLSFFPSALSLLSSSPLPFFYPFSPVDTGYSPAPASCSVIQLGVPHVPVCLHWFAIPSPHSSGNVPPLVGGTSPRPLHLRGGLHHWTPSCLCKWS